jgi:rod shape-determining protein MreD
MRPALALFAVGIAALLLRSVLSGVLPSGLGPDLGLVVVVALGLQLPGTTGLLLAAALGGVVDVLTGALLGQHAALFVMAFGLTRLAASQLDLGRGRPIFFLVAALSVAHGLSAVALSRLFGSWASWPGPERLLGQAGLDATLALLLLPLLARLVHRLSDDDRRAVKLVPRRREA